MSDVQHVAAALGWMLGVTYSEQGDDGLYSPSIQESYPILAWPTRTTPETDDSAKADPEIIVLYEDGGDAAPRVMKVGDLYQHMVEENEWIPFSDDIFQMPTEVEVHGVHDEEAHEQDA